MKASIWVTLNGYLIRCDAVICVSAVQTNGTLVVTLSSGDTVTTSGAPEALAEVRNQLIVCLTGEELPS